MDGEIQNNVTEVTENTEAQAVEELDGGIELTDTFKENEEVSEERDTTEKAPESLEKEEEQKPKGRYVTDEELNRIVDKRVARKLEKAERDMSVYRDTEEVLKSTLKAKDMTEANKKLRDFYTEQGVQLPEPYKAGLSSREVQALAKMEAEDIIEDGYEAMVEEANRLASKKYENLSEKEKIVFTTLADKLTYEKDKKDLLKIGAKEDVINDDKFINFRKQFNSKTPIQDIYSLYEKSQSTNKPEIEPMGSMKTNSTPNSTVKDFYTREEAMKFTREDFDKNPELFKAVENSMYKW